jgi:hypothetical protein
MKFLHSLVLATGIALAAVSNAASQQPAQSAPSPETLLAARELTSITSVTVLSRVVSGVTEQVWPSIEASLRLKNPTIDPATLGQLRHEYENLQVSSLFDSLNETTVMYARYFTAEELRDIVAFYRTPTGAKALAVMPQVSAELMGALAPRMLSVAAAVNQRFSAILQQRGYVP